MKDHNSTSKKNDSNNSCELEAEHRNRANLIQRLVSNLSSSSSSSPRIPSPTSANLTARAAPSSSSRSATATCKRIHYLSHYMNIVIFSNRHFSDYIIGSNTITLTNIFTAIALCFHY